MSSPKQVETRPLGKLGPNVPRLGLGLMSPAGAYGQVPSDEDFFEFLDRAHEMGETLWDTANEYGRSEELIGKWFSLNPEKRKDIFLVTKFGMLPGRGPEREKGLKVDSSPEHCREAIEKSLARLQTSYVDLYLVHRLDGKTPIEKTMDALVELKNAGRIKHIGLSECSASSMRRAHAVHPLTCVEVEYSAFCLSIESRETPILATARELGLGVICYSPMANGTLTGKIRDREDIGRRVILPWLRDENVEGTFGVLQSLSEIADKRGITLPQLALSWLLAQGDDIFPIPGSSKAERLGQNMVSMDVHLTAEEENEIREVCQRIRGGRVQDMIGFTFADTPPLDQASIS